ncbi:ABC transporter permease [Lactococcus nasutitermitis]|uniref:ABC transporter permease n=1 Tax=Lactococcus nasutitermitis TaxID=1652957 RepID=A0ABV9JF94_9LACT|nr:ABC-2 family transporter protein [Lactococcus nasutitermitis]
MPKLSNLRAYLPFFHAGYRQSLAYQGNFLIYRLADATFALVAYFLWRAVFSSSTSPNLGGFTLPEMIIYVFLSFYLATLTSSWASGNIGQEIKDGSIAMRLLKPVNYSLTYFFEEIGAKLMQVAFMTVILLGGIVIFQLTHPHVLAFHLGNFLLFVMSSLLAYLISYYFDLCFGFTAFIFQNLWGANNMKSTIVNFFSGSLIPLAFFPPLVASIFSFLPFASLIYTPIMIYLGRYNPQQLTLSLVLQVFWTLFFYVLSKIIWRAVIGHLTVQGG